MEIQRVWAAYFSPTGTTEKIVTHLAEHLAKPIEHPVLYFDFTLPPARQEAKRFLKSDLVVFGVPVYAGRVPNVLLKYLNTLEGNGAQAVPVVLFGNRNYDEALKELRNLLELRGFQTVAAGAFVGEHAFSYTLGKGRPDYADLSVASEFARRIFAVLRTGQVISPVRLDNEGPLGGYYQPRDQDGNPIDIRKVRPKTRDTCTDCGYCAQICPMGSIDPADVRNLSTSASNAEPASKNVPWRPGTTTTRATYTTSTIWRRPTPDGRSPPYSSERPLRRSWVWPARFFPQYPWRLRAPLPEVQSSFQTQAKRSPAFWAGERFAGHARLRWAPEGGQPAIAVVHNRLFCPSAARLIRPIA